MDISIICPAYNGAKYIEELDTKIKDQVLSDGINVNINYVLTESNDGTEEILKSLCANYKKIAKNEYSHSLTREKMAMQSDSDIIVFISQDIKICNDNWLNNLLIPIIDGECEATFSRQICSNNSIEKYTRENNYPEKSRIVSKADIERLGLMTFFYSDASSAIRAKTYKNLNGYDGKKLIINEDMYIAEKIIGRGYRIKYCADSIVDHSHIFTFKQLFKRYFDTGVFFAENKQFSNYSGSGNGLSMLKKVVIGSISEKNYKVLLRVIPDFLARFIGSNLGKRYSKLPNNIVRKFSLDKNYWN